jgi:hypothetical protein
MKSHFFISLFLVGLLAGCSPSTSITKSWIDPSFNAQTAQSYKKILVVAPMKDEQSKRIAEDKIVASVKNGKAVQSYTYLTATDTDAKQVEAKMLNDGFDAIILMRLQSVDKSVGYSPGTTYGGWYGYRYSTPGYVYEDKTFYVETNFYDLKANKLLWAGTTATLNPTQIDQTLDDIIATVRYELKKKGIIKE